MQLPRTTRLIRYEASGQGNSLLQFSYQYYITENQMNSDINKRSTENITAQPRSMALKFIPKKINSLITLDPAFNITPIAKTISEREMLLEVCFKYQPSKDILIQKTNMIILNICLPSGYISNYDYTQELLEEEIVTKVELQNSDTTIIVYFDQLRAKEEHCLHIRGQKAFDVNYLRPTNIEMYDYYNENLRTTVFYEIKI